MQGVEAIAPANGPPSPLPAVDMQRCREREAKALQVECHSLGASTQGMPARSPCRHALECLPDHACQIELACDFACGR